MFAVGGAGASPPIFDAVLTTQVDGRSTREWIAGVAATWLLQPANPLAEELMDIEAAAKVGSAGLCGGHDGGMLWHATAGGSCLL